jgi:hypothetical protein
MTLLFFFQFCHDSHIRICRLRCRRYTVVDNGFVGKSFCVYIECRNSCYQCLFKTFFLSLPLWRYDTQVSEYFTTAQVSISRRVLFATISRTVPVSWALMAPREWNERNLTSSLRRGDLYLHAPIQLNDVVRQGANLPSESVPHYNAGERAEVAEAV